MRHHHQTLAMSLLAALSVPAVHAQDATRTLIEQGKYWQSRGDAQRAAEAWRKLLKLNPTQPDALGGMAVGHDLSVQVTCALRERLFSGIQLRADGSNLHHHQIQLVFR